MNKVINSVTIGVIMSGIMFSCNQEDDSGFSIKFSDGTAINESDITFYDSSTCVLFLDEILSFQFVSGESPNIIFSEFSVLVNGEDIYNGIIYPELYAALPPVPFYISSITSPNFESTIVRIMYSGFHTQTPDARNDPRIINALENSSLLRNGLTCSLDSVYISALNDSLVIYSFTIRNHDQEDYYIPDPEKMGNDHFNYYTGGLYMWSKEPEEYYHPRIENTTSDWNILSMGDLSILDGNGQVSYTVEASYYSSVGEGVYMCSIRYGNLMHLYSFNLALDQEDGRVWVGESFHKSEIMLVKEN